MMPAGALRWLERGGAALRSVGLGALVDRAGPAIGAGVARRPVNVRGLRIAGSHVGQLYYFRELAQGRDAFLAEVLAALLPAGGCAVDGGAHIGYLTLELARAAGPSGRVFAFEPDPRAAATLCRNLRRNRLEGHVAVHVCALGARAGRAQLHLSGGGETNSLTPVPGSTRAITVPVTTVDDVVPADVPVDLIKLDLEGAETAALRGMTRTLERGGDRVALLVEVNPPLLEAAGSSPSELLARLDDLGFEVRRVDEQARRLVRDLEVPGGYANVVCARGGRRGVLGRWG